MLQSLGLRSFLPQVSACPGCGRTTSTFFQEMAQQIQALPQERMPEWQEAYPGVEDMRVAVMGCVVNGPGESKHADIGISLPGTFEEPVAPVFVDGKLDRTLRGEGLVDEFIGDPRGLRRTALSRVARVRAPCAGRRAASLTAERRRCEAEIASPGATSLGRKLVGKGCSTLATSTTRFDAT